jgi:diguanylate cyclase (GGDEF)-like protein/putative nucleotidyltransferase with HDIG domain
MMSRRAVILTVVACVLGLLAMMFATRTWEADHPRRLVLYFIAAAAGVAYVGWRERGRTKAEQTARLHMRTVEALALAIEAMQHSSGDHLQRVRVYAIELGKRLKLPPDEMEALRMAALLHNIGRLAVPRHLNTGPGLPVSEELSNARIHTVVGAAILESVQFPYPVVPIVRSHHERWDGTGYPDGLRGEQIPIGARILAAVDGLSAIANGGGDQAQVPMEEAVLKLTEQSGLAFDPEVVALLAKHWKELEALAARDAERDSRLSATQAAEASKADRLPDLPVNAGAAFARPRNFVSSIAAARMEAETVFEISSDLGNSLNLDETLSAFSIRLKRIVPFSSIAAYIVRDQELVPEYVSGDNFRLIASLRIPMGEGLSGWTAANRRAILNGDPCREPGYVEPAYGSDTRRFSPLRSAITVPLEGLHGVVGVLTLYHTDEQAYTGEHLRLLQTISPKVALSVENALAFRRAESSATTDYLTNLPNARALFLHLDRELARCRRLNASVTVMVCDLDGFKDINDRFGHLEGNRILKIFAQGLQDSCREYDYVARMGGDEFVIVAPGLTDPAAVLRGACLNELAKAAGRQVCGDSPLSLSVGYAICPEDGSDAEKLLAEADRRMYLQKQRHHQGDFAHDAGDTLPSRHTIAN